jgi:hypothetical protein
MLRSIAAIDTPAALLTEAWLAVQPPTEPVQVGPARGVGLQPIDLDRPQAA